MVDSHNDDLEPMGPLKPGGNGMRFATDIILPMSSIGSCLPTVSYYQVKLGGVKLVNGEHLLSSAMLGASLDIPGTHNNLAHNALLMAEHFGCTERNLNGFWRLTPKGRGVGRMYNNTVVWYPVAVKYFRKLLNLDGGPFVHHPQALPPIPPTKPE